MPDLYLLCVDIQHSSIVFYMELFLGAEGGWFAGRAVRQAAASLPLSQRLCSRLPGESARRYFPASLPAWQGGNLQLYRQPVWQPGPSIRPPRISSSDALPAMQGDVSFLFTYLDVDFLHSGTPFSSTDHRNRVRRRRLIGVM